MSITLNSPASSVGNRVTVGHGSVLHGCVVEDGALIGIGAIILNGASVGEGAIVAAGALVPEGMQVPGNTVVMVLLKIRRGVTAEERARFDKNCDNYVKITAIYKKEQS